MATRRSIASVLLFAGSLLCFFLPFATISCGGVKVSSLSGIQLATGTTITQQVPFGPPRSEKIAANPSAAVAMLCGLVGLILSIAGRKLATGSAGSAAAGVIALGVLGGSLKSQAEHQGMGMMQVTMDAGYTLCLLLFLSAAAWNVWLVIKARRMFAEEESAAGTEKHTADAGVSNAPLQPQRRQYP